MSTLPSSFDNFSKRFVNKKKLSQARSHSEFYQAMQRYEGKRRQKMMMLVIDKEKKEISELKKGVHYK